jgi:hypothetical protein
MGRKTIVNRLAWRYCKPIEGNNVLDKLAREGFTFPASYRECATLNNGGRPDKHIIDLGALQLSFRRLLRVDEGAENIAEVWGYVEGLPKGAVPFGDDDFGNFFCFSWPEGAKEPEVCFFNHETAKLTHVASTFDEFLSLLR